MLGQDRTNRLAQIYGEGCRNVSDPTTPLRLKRRYDFIRLDVRPQFVPERSLSLRQVVHKPVFLGYVRCAAISMSSIW